MKNYIKIFALSVIVLIGAGCSKDFLGDNVDPDFASTGTEKLLLPSAQASMVVHIAGLNDAGSIFTRQQYSLFESTFAINSSSYQSEWNKLYAETLKDLQIIIDQATISESHGYVGIAKVLKSYIFLQLVDFYGDVPFSEALRGESIISPAFEDDAAVYDGILVLLDSAISDLNKTTIVEVEGDLFYGGDKDLWIKAANTIKLKMFVNISGVDQAKAIAGINALIADDNLITAANGSEDFQFVFGDTQNPNNRHPRYNSNYDNTPQYLDNYFMLRLIERADPRLRYYVYRQSSYSDLDFDTTPCSSRTDCDSWAQLFATGLNYLGRDFGDPSGIPGDNALRSVTGLYPFGGKYDNSSYRTVNGNSNNPANRGAEGAGVMSFLSSDLTNFYLAEAMITMPSIVSTSTAREYFALALSQGLAKVRDFAESSSEMDNLEDVADWNLGVTNYETAILADYDAAAEPLSVVITEKHYAQFTNGTETYTDFRRTGYPSTLPASLVPAGPFPVRLPYPDSELSSNSNAPAPVNVNVPIFWDVN